MNTLYDFLTHVKGVEYILAVFVIAGYILYWEILKPKPFKAMVDTGKEDLEFIKKTGFMNNFKTVAKIVAAPFIGLSYIVILPFVFFYALGLEAINGMFALLGMSVSFEWRPTEAYLAGKKGSKKEEKEDADAKKDRNE